MSRRRVMGFSVLILILFMGVLCRVYWIATDTEYAASAGGQTVSETALPVERGNFLDCNGELLTGWKKQWYALCIPGDSSYATLFPFVPFSAQTELYERRNSVTPFLIPVDTDLSRNGIFTVAGAQRCLPVPIARHLIGYLDGDGYGVTGLEKAYDDLLRAAGDETSVICTTSAQGDLLSGTAPVLQTEKTGTASSVTLTLDTDLQRACEAVAQLSMPRGCILVMEVGTGKIRADVSMPEFDPDNIARSIEANDTSLIDRAFASFSAGSVFKVILATAAYEAGLDWFTHDCTGSVEIAGETFRCAQGRSHGLVNLRGALEQSCNCYFIELGQLLGGQRILQTAQRFGFGTPTSVAPGLKSSAGVLPSEVSLQNVGQLASVSFGQGGLTVTPVQITAMMNAIAGDGTLYPARFVESTEQNGGSEPVEPAAASRACSEDIARVLRSMLVSVVTDGIGKKAAPDFGGAGGKTGTAQTGQFDADGTELLNYWFTGFWPAEDPRYTITVLQDGTLEPETDSAELFAQIANALNVMENLS